MRNGAAALRSRQAAQWAAGVMLFLWLGTVALAASPHLHHLLHQDASGLEHHCLVTQLQEHPLLVSLALVLVLPPLLVALAEPLWAECQFFPVRDYRLSISRAPPR